jgi:hypothetical protein
MYRVFLGPRWNHSSGLHHTCPHCPACHVAVAVARPPAARRHSPAQFRLFSMLSERTRLAPRPHFAASSMHPAMHRPTPPRAAPTQVAAAGKQSLTHTALRPVAEEKSLLIMYSITFAAYMPATISWPRFVPTSNRPEGIKYRRAASRTPTNSQTHPVHQPHSM